MYWVKTFNVLINCKRLFRSLDQVTQHLDSIYKESTHLYKKTHANSLKDFLERGSITKDLYKKRLEEINSYDCMNDPDFEISKMVIKIDDKILPEYIILFKET